MAISQITTPHPMKATFPMLKLTNLSSKFTTHGSAKALISLICFQMNEVSTFLCMISPKNKHICGKNA